MLSRTFPDARTGAWEYALTAETNKIYYQHKVGLWTRADLVVRLVSAFAASATIVTFLRQHQIAGIDVAAALAVVSAGFGLFGASLRIPEKVAALSVLLVEYTGHANTFERLFRFGCTDEDLRAALKAWDETEKREAKDHPNHSRKLLNASADLVLKRLGAA